MSADVTERLRAFATELDKRSPGLTIDHVDRSGESPRSVTPNSKFRRTALRSRSAAAACVVVGLVALVALQGTQEEPAARPTGSAYDSRPTIHEGGKGSEMYPVTDLASLIGYSDQVVIARFVGARPGQTLYGVDGRAQSTDRLQDLEILTTLRGSLVAGDHIVLLEDRWNGAGQGIRSGDLDWLQPGDEALYFLDTLPGATTSLYGHVVYWQTHVAGRIVRGTDGSATVPDHQFAGTRTLLGLTFQEVISAVHTAMSEQAKEVSAATAAKAEQLKYRVPELLPDIERTDEVATLRDSSGAVFTLAMAERKGHSLCYSFALQGKKQPLDQCFAAESIGQLGIDTSIEVLPLGTSRVILGFTSRSGATSGTVGLGNGRTVAFELQDVPGYDGLRFFVVAFDAQLQPKVPRLA